MNDDEYFNAIHNQLKKLYLMYGRTLTYNDLFDTNDIVEFNYNMAILNQTQTMEFFDIGVWAISRTYIYLKNDLYYFSDLFFKDIMETIDEKN